MAFERRLEAVVIGPGRSGRLRVVLGRGENQFVAEVAATLLQPSLRKPNSEFVAIVNGREFVSVEPAGHAWLTIQDLVRKVLNSDWDPIGVADMVDDEYDTYIEHIYSLLAADAADQEVADYLLWVELERMGMTGTPLKELLGVAAKTANPPVTAPRPTWVPQPAWNPIPMKNSEKARKL